MASSSRRERVARWATQIAASLRQGTDWTEFALKHDVGNRDKVEEVRAILSVPKRFDPRRSSPLMSAAFGTIDVTPIARRVHAFVIFGKAGSPLRLGCFLPSRERVPGACYRQLRPLPVYRAARALPRHRQTGAARADACACLSMTATARTFSATLRVFSPLTAQLSRC